MSGRFWRAFVVVGLVLGGFAYGCGRTGLDDGFGPGDASSSAGTTGSTGQGGTGVGGKTGGGQGGIMAGTIVPCGGTACVAGKQSCCDRLVNGELVPTGCVSSSDPLACNDGLVSCAADIVCTTKLPKCCAFRPDVAFCLPSNAPCTPPGP